MKIPLIVQALSDKVHMTPIDWCVHPAFVVIVFEEGPKLTFDRDSVNMETVETLHAASPMPATSPVSPPTMPAHKNRRTKASRS